MKNGQRLTDKLVREAPQPAKGARIAYDADLPGFGARVTATGARAFVLNYRTRAGRERRYTIGAFPDWSTGAARKYAGDLKARIRGGHDPLAELEAERSAPTVGDLCDRFVTEYMPRLRPATRKLYLAVIEGTARHRGLRAHFRHMPVADLRNADVADFHRTVSQSAPTMANRSVAVLSRMLALAVRWEWTAANPAKGTERNPEARRQRFLRPDEIARLTAALATFPDRQAADVVRVLVLTGARSGETLAMRWEDLDLAAGVWVKPSSATKQKTTHRVPLSAAARQVLAGIPRESEWVFPGSGASGHRESIASAWPRICSAAGLAGPDGKPTVRIHDLRHTYASLLASAGLSLPIIGALLGHSQPATTARYAHLMDDPLRAAAERVGALVTGGGGADVVQIGGRS